jgi:hypothetical protein
MIKTIPNFIRNVPEIMEHINNHLHLFKPREGDDAHESLIPGVCSRFTTLKCCDMTQEMKDAVFADADFDPDLKYMYDFIQVQRYEPTDFIAPHRDAYSIRKLHLITLTDSDCDGLVCEINGGIEKLYDKSGQYIDFPYDAVHWVDPVKHLRYSIVIAE